MPNFHYLTCQWQAGLRIRICNGSLIMLWYTLSKLCANTSVDLSYASYTYMIPLYSIHTWLLHTTHETWHLYTGFSTHLCALLTLRIRIHGCGVLGCEVSIYLPCSIPNTWIRHFSYPLDLSHSMLECCPILERPYVLSNLISLTTMSICLFDSSLRQLCHTPSSRGISFVGMTLNM